MAELPIRLILAALVLVVAAGRAVGQEKPAADREKSPAAAREKSGAATEAEVRKTVAGLDSDEFEVREAAMRKLADLGRAALPAVIKAAAEGSPEATWRAIEVLNEFALSMDPVIVDGAESALTKLAATDRPTAATRAKETLEVLAQSRHDRAIAMVTKFGGKFDYYRLTLDANWKGGLEGLVFVTRVLELRQINIEPASGLSDEDIAKLEAMLKNDNAERPIKITRFGKAFLGIGGGIAEGTNGVVVVSVVPGGPAADAGLEVNDVITQLDNEKIANFDQLIAYVRTKAVGDKVKITFHRDGEKKTGDAVLQARPGTREPEKVPPPQK